MRLQFDRTTFVFLLFVVIVAAIFGIQQFVIRQPPIEITIAVDPLAEQWVRAAATDYNNSTQLVNGTTRVQVAVIVVDDLDVWRNVSSWNTTNHPHGWIASSSLSLEYVPNSLPFNEITASLARTPLVWGGFDSRMAAITADGTRAFDWDAVQTIAAGQRWDAGGNVNMAINWPTSSMSGVGALFTAIAANSGETTITRTLVSDAAFSTWFNPIHDSVRNSERIGGSPAQAMASRGTTTADFALLPESQWLQSLSGLSDDGITFAYPAYQFILDFPMAVWDDTNTTDIERGAVQSFSSFLSGAQGQALAVDNGLRPVASEPHTSATLFVTGQPYGIQLAPDFSLIVQPDDRNTTDAVIRILE